MFFIDRKDRMSMSQGLEFRVPFCDYRIVEYAFNMPWEIKAYKGREKGILRRAMKGILPSEIVYRKKSPYPKTHNPVYMQLVSRRVKEILEDKGSLVAHLLNKEEILNIIKKNEQILTPWYGQLMSGPQILGYIIQIDTWIKEYSINLM